VTRILRRKVRRDLWRHRWQFLAATVVLAIGVAVFVGATNAYEDLRQSLDRTYAEQLLPDVVISGPGVAGLDEAARSLPGNPVVELRQQADVSVRVNGRTLFGRAVGVPIATQPAVSKLALQSGDLPTTGSVVTEEHLTEYYGLHPGSTVELLGPSGWRPVRVSGSAVSTEYVWPARSRAETLTHLSISAWSSCPHPIWHSSRPSRQISCWRMHTIAAKRGR
jgi:putative ABC transport system permease protein